MKDRSLILFVVLLFTAASMQAQDRTVLPPSTPDFKGKIGPNYKESTPDFSPALSVTAPDGAPDVLVIVLDDVRYGGQRPGREKP
jgi:arylsulfatase